MRGVSSQKPSGMPGEANRQRPSRHLPNPGKVNGYTTIPAAIMIHNVFGPLSAYFNSFTYNFKDQIADN
jgi:hypothetical protein